MKTMNKAREYTSDTLEKLFSNVDAEKLERTRKKMQLAVRLDEAIEAKGWTKKQFAEKLGKQPSEISKWLSGTHNFTTDTLWDIENILGV